MKKMNKKIFGIGVLSVMLLVSGCSNKTTNSSKTENSNKVEMNSQYEELGFSNFQFKGHTLTGDDISSDIFKDSKVTMINFWGTFCGPCKMELPHLAELSNEYSKEEFQILGVIADTSDGEDFNIKDAKEIVEKSNVTFPNLLNSKELSDKYLNNVQGLPTTIFVDKDGNLIGDVLVGARDKNTWKEIIDKVISEN
ncbi:MULTISPECIES: TlpA disulfide reductase family protein [Peptoniphilus]|uniref:TlpA family protein disulfide reductase n=1 Tax=Peptoniphilus TaxID=162289 RepID=UPI0001DA9B10|nr:MULTISPECIES: TlpA disulfide reductase family protein [Peptoniphilus]EFI42090.1 antioxidant, AhpC/TSA family [Peptoniphilus sp. oral taxon 386 str. F0131]